MLNRVIQKLLNKNREYIKLVAAIKRLKAERNYYKRLAEELEQNLLRMVLEGSGATEDDLK